MANIRRRGDTWQFRVSGGYDTNGKQIVHSKTWKPDRKMTDKQAQKEAERQALLFEEQCSRGEYLDSNIKFADFSQIWLDKYAKKQLKRTTVSEYTRQLKDINRIIGHIRLNKIQPTHIIDFNTKLEDQARYSRAKYKPMIDLGEYLAENNIPKCELSRSSGIAPSTIRSVCEGGNVTAPTAEKISKALNRSDLFMQVECTEKISGKTQLNYFRLLLRKQKAQTESCA